MNGTNLPWDFTKYYSWVRVPIYSLYALISTVGVCGNGLVIYVVLSKRSMRTITNLFILNLGLANMLMSCIAAPITPIAFYMDQWDLPTALCQLLPMTMAVSVYVSTWISLVIAIDRYIVIVHPFTTRMSQMGCCIVNVIVWFTATLLSCPYALHHHYNYNDTHNISECFESWSDEKWKSIFDWSSFCLQFVLPSLIIAYSYHRIRRVLRHRHLTKSARGILSNSKKEERDLRRKRRTTRVLIVMVTVFVVSWIPLNVLFVLQDSSQNIFPASWPYSNLIFFLCHATAMSSAVYNPFLYGWMNENFKREFYSMISCFACLPQPHPINAAARTEEKETIRLNTGMSPRDSCKSVANMAFNTGPMHPNPDRCHTIHNTIL